MPNWCDCELHVSGQDKDLQKFKEYALTKIEDEDDNVLDTNKFIPYPEKFKKLDREANELQERKSKLESLKGEARDKEELEIKKKEILIHLANEEFKHDGFNSGGYDWCCQNWGTKWGICNAEMDDSYDEELFYSFNSAWSPPSPVILKMSRMFKKLEFRMVYFECGSEINGRFICSKGKVEEDKTAEYFGSRGG